MDTTEIENNLEIKPKLSDDNDPFWFRYPRIIFAQDKLTEFFPVDKMTYNEKLNSILRFSIYTSFILSLYRRSLNMILLPVFVALVTLYIYKYNNVQLEEDKTEGFEIPKCTPPSKDNPFMNTLLTDIGVYKERLPACEPTKEVKELTETHFNHNLFKDVNDIYDRNNSQNRFFTMPNTTELGIKNGDTNLFANALYNNGQATCKEDTGMCTNSNSYFVNDLRHNPSLVMDTGRF